jgi:hypothetical protein
MVALFYQAVSDVGRIAGVVGRGRRSGGGGPTCPLDGIIKGCDSRFDVCRSFEGDVKGKAVGDEEAKEVPVGLIVAEMRL